MAIVAAVLSAITVFAFTGCANGSKNILVVCREAASEAERLRAGVEQIRNIRDMYAQEFRGILAKFDNQLNQAMNSQLGGAVDSVLEVREKPADEPQPEAAEEPQLKSEPGDFAAACGMLGVDPQEILK